MSKAQAQKHRAVSLDTDENAQSPEQIILSPAIFRKKFAKGVPVKNILLIIIVFIVAGCATPPGQLTENDFSNQNYQLGISASKAYSNLHDGFRYCGSESKGAIFTVHYGVPECSPPGNSGTILCDIYISGMYGGRSDWVLGKVLIESSSGQSDVTLSVKNNVANKQKIIDAWLGFLKGRHKEVCS